jgi:hypothetical protein
MTGLAFLCDFLWRRRELSGDNLSKGCCLHDDYEVVDRVNLR